MTDLLSTTNLSTTRYQKIVLYARFSDPNQRHGFTLERQFETLERDVERMGLAHLPVVRITDEGRSGYHGHHRSHGDFGDFEQEVLRGEHLGTLFITERLDRFSREGHEENHDLLRSFLRNGVSVKTLDGDFFEAGQRISLIQYITAAVKAELAHDESVKKAERTADNWMRLRRRCKAERLALTKLVPPWIIVNEDRTMRLDAQRAAMVERAFQMADAGVGARGIANTFNAEGIAPWERFEKRAPKMWGHSYISRLLANRAVIGEFHPKVNGKPCPDGPWLNHYPSVITADVFERVRAAADVREKVRGGAKSSEVQNLFSALVRCECCGNNLAYQKGRKEGVHYTKGGKTYTYKRPNGSLVCPVAYNKAKCTNRMYLAYLTFEDAVLDACLHIALDEGAFARKDEVSRLNVTIAERERALTVATERAEALYRAFSDNMTDMKKKIAEEAEGEAEALKANLKALKRQREGARGRVSSAEHLARVAGVRASLYTKDLAERRMVRLKVAQALRSVITDITVNADKVATIVVANGLGIIRIDGKGKLLTPMKDGLPVLHTKEYQLDALTQDGKNASRVTSVLARAAKKRA